ncbi:hypothetical protein BLA29_005232 [Euroglyphus maynei]|uniref:Uncharacterized protein n=1 Tax=Euroglyphus maynei TaxID=6958 RepID=A0A1Y3AVQ7_EURMA|nr:hypothetical protein BLA29_005232 [Euroglyphus maynei]
MIKTFQPLLANLLKILQKSIFDCDCGREPETTPDDAYNQLKETLQKISEKSFKFTKQLHLPTQPLKLNELEDFINNCQSYEQLLAHSVVNQIIEDGQSRFMTTGSTTSFNSNTSFIDHYSNHHMTHSGIKLIDNSNSWQDNWFFKKSKENKSYNQYHLNSDIHFGYMALALAESVPMLIPNPSQAMNPMLGEMEADQISDLSEHLSETGSIVFTSDEEEDDETNVNKMKINAEKNNSLIGMEIDASNTTGRSHTRNANKIVNQMFAIRESKK